MEEVLLRDLTLFLLCGVHRLLENGHIKVGMVQYEQLFALRPLHHLAVRVLICECNRPVIVTVIQELRVLACHVLRLLNGGRIVLLVCVIDVVGGLLQYGCHAFRQVTVLHISVANVLLLVLHGSCDFVLRLVQAEVTLVEGHPLRRIYLGIAELLHRRLPLFLKPRLILKSQRCLSKLICCSDRLGVLESVEVEVGLLHFGICH